MVPSPTKASRALALARAGVALGVGALLAAAASGLGHRAGLWSFEAGFAILGLAALCGLSALVLGIVAAASGRPARSPLALRMALAAAVLGFATTALPARQFYLASTLPRINDITTDTVNPPAYVAVAPLRGENTAQLAYDAARLAGQQQAAYPRVVAQVFRQNRHVVFNEAVDLVLKLGWQLHAADDEQGRIEASVTSRWFGFVDDVVIRCSDAGQGTRVDMRSKSRVGLSDVGANARRIERFLADLGSELHD